MAFLGFDRISCEIIALAKNFDFLSFRFSVLYAMIKPGTYYIQTLRLSFNVLKTQVMIPFLHRVFLNSAITKSSLLSAITEVRKKILCIYIHNKVNSSFSFVRRFGKTFCLSTLLFLSVVKQILIQQTTEPFPSCCLVSVSTRSSRKRLFLDDYSTKSLY